MDNKKYIPGFDKESFQVPDGYFEQLSKNIEQKIAEESTPPIRSVNKQLWSVISIAATLFIGFGIWWLTPASTTTSSASIATSEIIESGELDDLLLQQEDAILALVEEQPLLHNEDLSFEEISDYLIQEGVSESDIYNYLESY